MQHGSLDARCSGICCAGLPLHTQFPRVDAEVCSYGLGAGRIAIHCHAPGHPTVSRQTCQSALKTLCLSSVSPPSLAPLCLPELVPPPRTHDMPYMSHQSRADAVMAVLPTLAPNAITPCSLREDCMPTLKHGRATVLPIPILFCHVIMGLPRVWRHHVRRQWSHGHPGERMPARSLWGQHTSTQNKTKQTPPIAQGGWLLLADGGATPAVIQMGGRVTHAQCPHACRQGFGIAPAMCTEWRVRFLLDDAVSSLPSSAVSLDAACQLLPGAVGTACLEPETGVTLSMSMHQTAACFLLSLGVWRRAVSCCASTPDLLDDMCAQCCVQGCGQMAGRLGMVLPSGIGGLLRCVNTPQSMLKRACAARDDHYLHQASNQLRSVELLAKPRHTAPHWLDLTLLLCR